MPSSESLSLFRSFRSPIKWLRCCAKDRFCTLSDNIGNISCPFRQVSKRISDSFGSEEVDAFMDKLDVLTSDDKLDVLTSDDKVIRADSHCSHNLPSFLYRWQPLVSCSYWVIQWNLTRRSLCRLWKQQPSKLPRSSLASSEFVSQPLLPLNCCLDS